MKSTMSEPSSPSPEPSARASEPSSPSPEFHPHAPKLDVGRILQALSSIYDVIYELDYINMTTSELHRGSGTLEVEKPNMSLMDGCEVVVRTLVHPDDREAYLSLFLPESVRAHFADPQKLDDSVDVRMLKADGSYRWYRCSLIREEAPDNPYLFLSCVRDIDDMVTAQHVLEASEIEEQRVASLVHTVGMLPVGIGVFIPGENSEQSLINDRLAQIFGLDPVQQGMQAREKGQELLALYLLMRAREEPEPGAPTYEILETRKADGTPIWVKFDTVPEDRGDSADLVHLGRQYYCTISDETARIKLEQEHRMQTALYQMVLAQTHDLVFDYDPVADSVTFLNPQGMSQGMQPTIDHFDSRFRNGEIVYPQDLDACIEAANRVRTGADSVECDYRARWYDNEYRWYRNEVRCVKDDDGNLIHAVGLIREISEVQHLKEELASEQKSRCALEVEAEIDPVTQLYNRNALYKHIGDKLSDRSFQGVFMIFDLDNFKKVNDTHGHQTGDMLLKALGSCLLLHTRRKTDIVGRLGGDEFMMLMPGIVDRDVARRKADAIVGCVRQIRGELKLDDDLGVSVGIAMVPESGQDLADLYEKADTALYEAKRSGKNRSVFA